MLELKAWCPAVARPIISTTTSGLSICEHEQKRHGATEREQQRGLARPIHAPAQLE
jgi:hypothetical protein